MIIFLSKDVKYLLGVRQGKCKSLQLFLNFSFINLTLYTCMINNLVLTCSTKCCDNLLVEADNFYHFRGIISCNTKRLQFNRNKKQELKGTVQQVFYTLTSSFYKLVEFLVPFEPHKNLPRCKDYIVNVDGCWIKI